jgi:hypothetical protein
MEQLEALEELREISERKVKLTYEDLVKSHEEIHAEKRKVHEIEDELLVQKVFGKKNKAEIDEDEVSEEAPRSLPILKKVDESELESTSSSSALIFPVAQLGTLAKAVKSTSNNSLKSRLKIKPKTT